MSIQSILVNTARAFVQAARIAFLLFWWFGDEASSAYIDASKSTEEENQVKGSRFTASGRKSSGVACKVCGSTNEAGEGGILPLWRVALALFRQRMSSMSQVSVRSRSQELIYETLLVSGVN